MSSNKKYPLLIKNYGAPRFQSVTKENVFDTLPFSVYLASSSDIITAIIDGHGSANQGFNRSTYNYRKLGTSEVDDQIIVAKYLIKTLDIIDESSIAIMGTSYGGYVALKAIARMSETNDNILKCAIAISPVTDWFYYDAVYSERYMGLPIASDNEVGYRNSSLFPDIDKLIKQKIFLIQGSSDDNVHIDQTMKLIRYIVSESARAQEYVGNLKYMMYPDQNHYFNMYESQKHMHLSVQHYLLNECFI